MAAAGKDGKEKKGGKDEAASAALRRITEELAALRSDIDAIRKNQLDESSQLVKGPNASVDRGAGSVETSLSERLEKLLTDSSDAAMSIAYSYRIRDSEGTKIAAHDEFVQHGLQQLLSADDARVARLGYSLSSGPKVAILRILLTCGHQSAAQVGEKSGLTTGSLYHHLRELTHAAVIESTARNRFELTEIGRETTLLLFAQAGRLTAGG